MGTPGACEALGDVVIDAGGAACDFSAESLAALLDTGLEDSYEVVRVQAAAAVGRVAVDALEKEADVVATCTTALADRGRRSQSGRLRESVVTALARIAVAAAREHSGAASQSVEALSALAFEGTQDPVHFHAAEALGQVAASGGSAARAAMAALAGPAMEIGSPMARAQVAQVLSAAAIALQANGEAELAAECMAALEVKAPLDEGVCRQRWSRAGAGRQGARGGGRRGRSLGQAWRGGAHRPGPPQRPPRCAGSPPSSWVRPPSWPSVRRPRIASHP